MISTLNLLCDEPVSALDVSIKAQILILLIDLQKDLGLTCLFVTHDHSVVKHISNRVAVMNSGEIVEMTETNELFANPLHHYAKVFLSAVPAYKSDVKLIVEKNVLKGDVSSKVKIREFKYFKISEA